MDIIFATNNAHKLTEVQAVLGPGYKLLTPRDCGVTEEIPEEQDTLEGNASQKAYYLHERTGMECFARRLQVQERLTVQIRDCIQEALNPMGVAVVIEASHMCMQMRGIEKQQSATTTSAFTGIFLSDHRTREEFMTLISHRYR